MGGREGEREGCREAGREGRRMGGKEGEREGRTKGGAALTMKAVLVYQTHGKIESLITKFRCSHTMPQTLTPCTT